MRINGAIILGVAVLGLLSGAAMAAPGAGMSSTAWQLEVQFHDPQRVTIKLPGDRQETTYWYLLYEVTNNTGQDRQFFPSFELVTGTLSAVRGGSEIHPLVYDAIAARHRVEFPFFAPPTKVTGLLLQGRANARASAAVFRSFDPQADTFTIFASGLSGEFKRIPNPVFDVKSGESPSNRRFFVLRRTLSIEYDLPGDARSRSQVLPIRRTRSWVMR